MTRTRWIVAIALPLAVLVTLPLIALAGSSESATREYAGTTSQNLDAAFETVKTADGWALDHAAFDLKVRCEDSTKVLINADLSFAEPVLLDSKSRFDVDENALFEAIHVHGRLGKNAGSGTVELNVGALTQDEKPQLCTSKEREWTATTVGSSPTPSTSPSVASGTPVEHLRISVDANGTAHVTRSP